MNNDIFKFDNEKIIKEWEKEVYGGIYKRFLYPFRSLKKLEEEQRKLLGLL